MKKIVASLLILFFSSRLAAQIDYLEPMQPVHSYKGELGEYYRNVFSLLSTDFLQRPYARYLVIPSFSPEYAMSVEKKNGRCYLLSNTLSRTYWQSEKGAVKVNRSSVAVSPALYQSLGAIFQLVTSQIQDMDGFSAGMDGVVYYFASSDAKGNLMTGRKWSPEKGSLMERLVQVCQSAYLLSKGENISEQALTAEASTLLKELKTRAEEQVDAYKKPIYVGIYAIGIQEKALGGKQQVEQAPRFANGSVEDYMASQMVYPAALLSKNVSGYALCEFTLDKEGVILRPHILKSTLPEFAQEALRMVKGMPKWTPAFTGGKAVECNYTLYIPFRPSIYNEHLRVKSLKKK